MKRLVAVILSVLLLPGCAVTYRMAPVAAAPATIRYDRGAPTTTLQLRHGAVQVTPMMVDGGKLVFAVAAYNDGNTTDNFGTENIRVAANSTSLHVYTTDELVREARNQAVAASVALALIGIAGVAASQAAAHQSYHSTYATPHGTYHYSASYYDAGAAAVGTAASIGATGAGIYAVENSLDAAIAGIGENVLQTTTIDPGQSAAGRVLIQAPRSRTYPQEVTMVVYWNGENYAFRFQISKQS